MGFGYPASFSTIRSQGRNYQIFIKHWPVNIYRVPQMRGAGHEDVLVVFQVPGNKAGAVPCERLLFDYTLSAKADL